MVDGVKAHDSVPPGPRAANHDHQLLALLDTLFTHAPFGMAFLDRALRYVRVNYRLAEINGHSIDAHLGRTPLELNPLLDPRIMDIYRDVLDEGRSGIEREVSAQTAAQPGVVRHFITSHYPVRSPNGAILGVGVIVEEVTQRKRAEAEREELIHRERKARADAEAERQRLHALFMQAPAAIAVLRGPNHVYELSNAINSAALGRDPTGMPARSALPELDEQGYGVVLDRVYLEGQRFEAAEAPLSLRLPSGETREAFVNAVYEPMRGANGEVEGVLVFGFEVTDLVHARRRAERLEEEAKQAVRMRDEFISIAGHELRTPLAALELQISTMARQLSKSGSEYVKLPERLQKTRAYVQRLESLVSDLLDVTRIAAGKLELRRESTNLALLAAEIVERFETTAAHAGCTLKLEIQAQPVGDWDAGRIDQVITNLLSNAIKYGANHPVELLLEATEKCARLCVRDHGIGIEPQALEQVFERFERAQTAQKFAGLGLGLWISRQIVTAHGGKIWLTSTPHAGTTAILELPLRTELNV